MLNAQNLPLSDIFHRPFWSVMQFTVFLFRLSYCYGQRQSKRPSSPQIYDRQRPDYSNWTLCWAHHISNDSHLNKTSTTANNLHLNGNIWKHPMRLMCGYYDSGALFGPCNIVPFFVNIYIYFFSFIRCKVFVYLLF